MGAPIAKTERISCRITPDGKRLLEHIATRHGVSISDYFVNLAIDIAGRELMDELVIRIPPDEWENMLALLDEDTAPNEKLTDAMRTFAQGTFTGDVYHAPD